MNEEQAERLALFVDLRGRRVLVVGAGPVGERRALAALRTGARVSVVAPTATPELQELAAAGDIAWHRREYRSADAEGAWLIHAATGVPAVDDAVVADADARQTWSVRAADGQRSAAWTAATTRSDDITVAVSGGGDPRRAQRVRDAVADRLASGDIPQRRRRKPAPGGGRVALVGGGPGDPELLTMRGRRLLRSADVIVADHLVPAAVLADLDADVEVRYAGKRPGYHSLTQEQINEFIVDRARDGHRVVRLKGGDPFLLGRGGEEALACQRAGIPVEVVPGVTSAVAVPAAAGIPVTHRGITSSFLLLSGHAGAADLADKVAAAPADATLVLLMGTGKLASIMTAVVAAGRPADTPAAIIERGWTPQQRTVTGTVSDIADIAARAGVRSPAIVVIGEVVSLRSALGDLAAISPAAGHTLPEHTRDGSPVRSAATPEELSGPVAAVGAP